MPPGWGSVPLAELCTILSGGTPAKSEPAYWQGDIPWVSGKDMKAPRLRDAIDHISEEGLAAGSRLAPAGTVFLLVRGMGLAKDLPVAVALRPMAFNQDIKALVPKRRNLGPYIRAAIYHARARLLSRIVPSAHGTMTLNLDDIESFGISMPPTEEEAEAIGSALDLVIHRAEKGAQELALVQDLKRAAARELFTRGMERGPQKETNFGSTPEAWDMRPIGAFTRKIQYGLSIRGERSGRYPILRMNCQQNGKVVMRDLQFVDLDEPTARAYQVRPGDILFNRTNSYELVGRTAIVEMETDAVFASYLVRLSLDESRLDPRFLNHFLNWDVAQSELRKLASRGVSQANISAGKLRDFPVPVPALEEQREIIAVLDAVDAKIELHKRKRVLVDRLFASVLHKFMTGDVRVADVDLSALEPRVGTEAAA